MNTKYFLLVFIIILLIFIFSINYEGLEMEWMKTKDKEVMLIQKEKTKNKEKPKIENKEKPKIKQNIGVWVSDFHTGLSGDYKHFFQKYLAPAMDVNFNFYDQSLAAYCVRFNNCANETMLRGLSRHTAFTLCPNPFNYRQTIYKNYAYKNSEFENIDLFICIKYSSKI
jgi:hypothetical protein